ncbi:Uncharacterized protein GBIM_09101 [Gryllus bimaculatus]|nr:Uncharacterized protein GBIM_09101 [Gryllus bimaculatus]
METSLRKSRSSNFTIKEKALLVTLVRKYEDTIENKKSDKVGTTAKHKAWCYLTKEFNASSGETPRTIDTLHNCWNNLKKTTRRILAGNASRANSLNCIEEQVMEVIGVPRKGSLNIRNDDTNDAVIIKEKLLSSNCLSEDSKRICLTTDNLPIVEKCFSLTTNGTSEEVEHEGFEENPTIPANACDPLSVEQLVENSSTPAENDGNALNWCKWTQLNSDLLSPLQNTENNTQHREKSDPRRTDVIQMMMQQMKEEVEFRREEAQHKRELFKIQKQQELVKLKILQKALESANVTISMSGTSIHIGEK